MTLTMCGTIINSVMAISNPKIGSCSIPRYPKLQAQEPLLEACSVFAPGVATIVTSGSKHTMSIQCDTDTSPPWNHLVRDAQDVSELGFPFFNMTSYTCGARLPCRWWSLDMPHTYFCGQVQIPPQKPDLEDLAVCLWHTGKNCFHGCTVRFFLTNSFLTLSEVFSIWNQWNLRFACASMQAIIKTKKIHLRICPAQVLQSGVRTEDRWRIRNPTILKNPAQRLDLWLGPNTWQPVAVHLYFQFQSFIQQDQGLSLENFNFKFQDPLFRHFTCIHCQPSLLLSSYDLMSS